MSKENSNQPITFTRLITIMIIFVSIMSLLSAMFIYISQGTANSYATKSQKFDNLAVLYETDVQAVLQEDSMLHELAYSYLNELYYINYQVAQLRIYNNTYENVSQAEFDTLVMEFVGKMNLMNDLVEESYAYSYVFSYLSAMVENNFTYRGETYYLIHNRWYEDWGLFDQLIMDELSLEPFPKILSIDLPVWTGELYNNLSILQYAGCMHNAYNFIEIEMPEVKIVNLSYSKVLSHIEAYDRLEDMSLQTSEILTTALIAFALSAVILGYVVSIVDKRYRKISLLVGIVIAILSLFVFISGVINLVQTDRNEAMMLSTIEY